MKLEDTFRMLCSAYYGVREMDEYELKEYVLKDISDYIKEFIKDNPIDEFDYEEEARKVEENTILKVMLQDSLIVLPKVKASMELILMIKQKLNDIRDEEMKGII